MSKDAWFTGLYPSSLYHELAHHIQVVREGESDHGPKFYAVLIGLLKADKALASHVWSNEYDLGICIAKQLNYLPTDYDPRKWDSILDMEEDNEKLIISPAKREEVKCAGSSSEDQPIAQTS